MDNWHNQHKNDPNIKQAREQATKRYHEHGKTDPDYIARRREYGRAWRAAHKKESLASRKQYYKEHPEYAWLDTLKHRAKKLNVPFDLTAAHLRDIMVDVCPVLGIPLTRTANGTSINTPSFDRIVPELGYVKTNIIVVSMLANQIKSCASPDQIRKVADFYQSLIESRAELRSHLH